MKKMLASALSAVALSWIGGSAMAQAPTQQPASMPNSIMYAPNHQHQWVDNGDCCDHGGAYGEVGFLLLKPRWDNNAAFITRSFNAVNGGVNGTISSSTVTSFQPDFDWMPRVVLGFGSRDGIGFRTRWVQGKWDDTQTSIDSIGSGIFVNPSQQISTASPLINPISTFGAPDAPASLLAQSDLSVLTWDFESTKEAKIANLDLLMAGGVRYLHMSQNYNVFINTPGGQTFTDQLLVSGHNLNGLGPTVALDGRLPIGGGLSIYSTGRVSGLFAKGKQTAFSAQAQPALVTGEVPTIIEGAYQERNAILTMTEIEVGGEWRSNMGRSEVYVQGGFVGQMLYGAGNSSRSGNFANESNCNLGLFGLAVSAGFRF